MITFKESIGIRFCDNCRKKSEFSFTEKTHVCISCGETTTAFEFSFKDGNDCSECYHFKTNSVSYPSGKCTKHDVWCGLGQYCEDIQRKL